MTLPISDDALAAPINISLLVMKVVSLGLATYHEMATVYDHEDALDMIEIYEVSEYNKQLIMEAQNEFTQH